MPSLIRARQAYYNNCSYGYYNNGYCRSAWDIWARWLVLTLIVLGIFLIFFLFSCISARRRRKLGYQPYRGTGWALGRTPPGHGPAQYNQAYPQREQPNAQPYYNNSNNPPPAYGTSQEYYGGGRPNDVELQSPQPVYGNNRKENTYAPPSGPPPGRY